ncbi:hypothetical protein D3C81_474740 [compost metagenome]
MKFAPGLPTAFSDETITSWLYRVFMKSRVVLEDPSLLLADPQRSWVGVNAIAEDLDFNFGSTFIKKALLSLSLDANLAKCFFDLRGIVPVSPSRRTLFCQYCVREDVASGQMPGWRKQWCARDAVMCNCHNVDLSQLLSNPTFQKSWDAFAQTAQPTIVSDIWLRADLQRLRMILMRRIQRWKGFLSVKDARLFGHLYELFLSAPTYNHDAGVAHYFYGRRPARRSCQIITLQDAIFYGVELSDVQARFASQVLAAYVLGGIQEQELSVFRHRCLTYGVKHPEIEEIIPMIRFSCATVDDYCYLHRVLGRFSRKKGSKVDQLFLRFEKTVGVRIFNSSLRFGC